jgi:hypothetical protein
MAGMGEPARGVRALGAMETGQVQSALKIERTNWEGQERFEKVYRHEREEEVFAAMSTGRSDFSFFAGQAWG